MNMQIADKKMFYVNTELQTLNLNINILSFYFICDYVLFVYIVKQNKKQNFTELMKQNLVDFLNFKNKILLAANC